MRKIDRGLRMMFGSEPFAGHDHRAADRDHLGRRISVPADPRVEHAGELAGWVVAHDQADLVSEVAERGRLELRVLYHGSPERPRERDDDAHLHLRTESMRVCTMHLCASRESITSRLITGDAPRNVDFYTRVLGFRLVKKTVNQDDPTVYHLFYADEKGSAGSDITFFEYPGAARGKAGPGMVHTIVWRVGSEDSLDFWEQRLEGEAGNVTRSGESLSFEDPEGVRHEFAVDKTDDQPLSAKHPEIPEEHALRGFAGVRAYAIDPERSSAMLEDTLGFKPDGDYTWEARGDQRGGFYAYDTAPDGRGIPGAGTVHHVAWATNMDEHDAWQQRVAEAGLRPTPVIDRFYFKSIYFREPNGILFELATLGPGFATDEDPEHLGERLSLPPAFEHLREQIEPALTPLPNPRGMTLRVLERPAAGEPEGSLVLLHGRGADEYDLHPLLDALDPERRLHGVTPRGPLALPPGGAHWYRLGGIPTPEPETFWPSFAALAELLDGLPQPIVLGGFSQGTAMTWALSLGRGPAKRPLAIIALSGFVPNVEGLEIDVSDLDGYPVAIAHGALDPVIPVDWGRAARDLLSRRRRRRRLPRVPAPAHDRPGDHPGASRTSSPPLSTDANDAFAVAGNAISRVGLNEIPAGTTHDRVAGAVAGKDRVVSGTREETIGAGTAHERVRAAQAVEDVAAAEPEQAVRPVRAPECVPSGGAPADRPLYTLRGARPRCWRERGSLDPQRRVVVCRVRIGLACTCGGSDHDRPRSGHGDCKTNRAGRAEEVEVADERRAGNAAGATIRTPSPRS